MSDISNFVDHIIAGYIPAIDKATKHIDPQSDLFNELKKEITNRYTAEDIRNIFKSHFDKFLEDQQEAYKYMSDKEYSFADLDEQRVQVQLECQKNNILSTFFK